DGAARLRRAHRRRGLRQDRGDERGQRGADRLPVPRQASRPARPRRRTVTGVDRLLAEYIAEHQAGGEADPGLYLSRASPSEQGELGALIDAYLARAPRQAFDEAALRGSSAERTVDELERAIAGQGG